MTEHVEDIEQSGPGDLGSGDLDSGAVENGDQDNLDALADAVDAQAADDAADAKPELTPLAAAEQERDALRDKNLRLTAELANVRRRADQEKAEAIRYAEAGFAKDLLTVLDDFTRTLESAATASEVKVVTDGVRIMHEHFLKVLADHKIEPIAAVGQPFNPDVHEALLQQPSTEHAAGAVMQEVATGYRMHDRVIRAARVIVSSGPPAETPSEPTEPSVDEEA